MENVVAVHDKLASTDGTHDSDHIHTCTPKYSGVFSSDITPSTDGHEESNGWISHVRAGTPRVIRDVRNEPTHPNIGKRQPVLKHQKDRLCCLLPHKSGRGSRMVKVSYRIVAGLVTSSSPVPLKTRRVSERCKLNLSKVQASSRWKPKLTLAMKAKRLNWAKQWRDKGVDFWRSNKSQFVRRRRGEKFHSDCVIQTVKHPTKIMIWSVISGKGTGRTG
ncbi:uncharacterized protein TNCV_1320931 [Trichonephila clavipes]|nr:uncharacterized protein TNCV_1320931 [Trichonephila clavipes]